ncbi:PREDICTED: RNA polymerase II subunit A C-terminal domain phosphatase isoform X1 [Rhagoletis zephyria]|uniref:RNA polymerase II subunit A C-terminal domain phosphatase isoform X1 n=3 Tax=Rhagoletis TaxID=28609 RepID=UPI000811850D|nr:PREDICTED: RNA polymerase II subunit A C-terminal domain phosphatase isoform X1 [Rhagoletis zephyria]XP_017463683.1 PREDICTED: RNA polymerase II subunit A C-terminal domain phosphatase isoform X1 [Rhagoletis zephyria]
MSAMADGNNESSGESGGGSAGSITITAPAEHPIRINKWRVREGFPITSSQVILLYEITSSDNSSEASSTKTLATSVVSVDKTLLKLKANRVGVVKKRLYKEGQLVPQGATILELAECAHTTVIKDMCADCGADLRQNENGNTSEASVPMVHSIPDLKVTQKLAQKLGHDDTRRLLEDRKLVLLVDLDQTVIHTTNDNVPNNIKGIYHFQLYGPHSPWYHTRLRPGTPVFLDRMSKFYELHICTFGARNYAHMIAQLLDPEGKYFSHRILSRDECFNATSKTDNLKALFPNGDSMVCIIDDREDVWNMASNLIQVKPYHFFQHTGDINAPPGLSKHELDGEGLDFKDLKNLTTDTSKMDAIDVESKEKVAESESSDGISERSETDTESKKDDIIVDVVKNDIKTNTEVIETSNVEPVDVELDVLAKDNVIDIPDANKATVSISDENYEDKLDNKLTSMETEAETTPKIKLPADPHQQIEIEDPDDYLMYLEEILKNIHMRFYAIYDETQEIPDLKIIVPKIRSEVLRGKTLIFSGLVPTNMQLEQSRAYFIAKSLGANVSQSIGPETTHLVAVNSGTFKVNAAKKNPNIKVVNANWLWTCAERWEHVDERLFPLDRKTKSRQRKPPAHCHSPEHVVNYSDKSEISPSSSAQQQQAKAPEKFIDTINPLLSFSNADLADMNKEFDQFFESDSSSEDEHINIENPPVDKTLRKRRREEKEQDRTREFFTRASDIIMGPGTNEDADKSSDGEDNDDDDESPSAKFRRGEKLPSDLEMGSDSDDGSPGNEDSGDDGEWNMMGAALEREFLGLDD